MDATNKYQLKIAYDGTNYSGWQVQPNSISIQGLIEKALQTLLKENVRLIGAGRTDAGVHAKGQVAHFCTDIALDCTLMIHALNGMLPSAIRIKEFNPAHPLFHSQYSAISKEYHYHLWLDKVMDPCLCLYRHHFCYKNFSLELLKKGAEHFVGTHDFTTFTNIGGNTKSNVRTLFRLDTVEQEGGVRLEFQGNGFLYKMVRNIVGTLLEVATQKRAITDIPELLLANDRKKAAAAAPAKGLFLMKINYKCISENDRNE